MQTSPVVLGFETVGMTGRCQLHAIARSCSWQEMQLYRWLVVEVCMQINFMQETKMHFALLLHIDAIHWKQSYASGLAIMELFPHVLRLRLQGCITVLTQGLESWTHLGGPFYLRSQDIPYKTSLCMVERQLCTHALLIHYYKPCSRAPTQHSIVDL